MLVKRSATLSMEWSWTFSSGMVPPISTLVTFLYSQSRACSVIGRILQGNCLRNQSRQASRRRVLLLLAMSICRSVSRTLSHAAVVWLSVALFYVYKWYSHGGDMKSSSTELRIALALESIVASAAATVLYAVDKLSAKFSGKPQYRVSEYTLHMVALLGGWPGAALSQQIFRHKCRKETFLGGFVASVTGYFVFVSCIMYLFG